jgi:outer membrane protein assembly factor BamB
MTIRLLRAALLALVAAALAFLFVFRPWSCGQPPAIPQGFGHAWVSPYDGRPAEAHPLEGERPPRHPWLAPNGASNMHGDAWASDTQSQPGPLGRTPSVRSVARGSLGGECATVAFDRRGRIVTVCASFVGMDLLLLDPTSLRELARYPLPQRPSTRSLNLRRIVTDTSGGAYFYLDAQDRAVLATSDHRIRVVAIEDGERGPAFRLEHSYDLEPALAAAGFGDDPVVSTLPDWKGRHWFATRHGLVGVVERGSGSVATRVLSGEEIQNSFAVDADAMYIVSDHALYAFDVGEDGAPRVLWREAYDRGTRRKPGMIHQGSGTTPTVLPGGLVAIADNAEPRVQVLVYRSGRGVEGSRLVCRVPVFGPGRSATENSLVGFGRSLLVENNWGYDLFPLMMFGRTGAGGLTRIDVAEDGSGCHVAWTSDELAQTVVPKLSLANGLLYVYTKSRRAPPGVDAYYLTAIDFRSGETVFRALTGTGIGWDNHWAPVTLGRDGTAYVGTLRGLIAVRDGS